MNHIDLQKLEVDWYKNNGKYLDRIKKDALGREYVVGDFSWEMNFSDRLEFVDILMKRYAERVAKQLTKGDE